MIYNIDGYIKLQYAIVIQAVKDIKYKQNAYVRNSAIKFLESGYCEALTGIDGKAVLEKIDEIEFEKGKRRGR